MLKLLPNSYCFQAGLNKLNFFSEIFQETKKHFNNVDPTKVTFYYIKGEEKYVVIDSEETFKEYKQSQKNGTLKVYFIENNQYRAPKPVFELNQRNPDSNFSQDKFEHKLDELKTQIENVLTQTENEFKRELNNMLKRINRLTSNNSKLKNYFEIKLYEKCQDNNIIDIDMIKKKMNLIRNKVLNKRLVNFVLPDFLRKDMCVVFLHFNISCVVNVMINFQCFILIILWKLNK